MPKHEACKRRTFTTKTERDTQTVKTGLSNRMLFGVKRIATQLSRYVSSMKGTLGESDSLIHIRRHGG